MSDDDDFMNSLIEETNAINNSGDKLDRIKETAKRVRELESKKSDIEEDLRSINKQIKELTERVLVKMMLDANMTSFVLEGDGNHPSLKFNKTTLYGAKIPEDKEIEAFAWLHDQGHGDIVKTQISVALGMGERDLAEQVEHAIADAGADFSSKLTVHSSTLKSFVKTEVEAGRAIPMDLFGVTIYDLVTMKKDK